MRLWQWFDTSMRINYYILADTYVESEDKLMVLLGEDYCNLVGKCDLMFDECMNIGYIM